MISLHKLVPPENRDLFDRVPELNRIWEAPALQAQARESYEEWDSRNYPEESSGEIFTILEDDKTIGIIGWFEYGDILDTMRLRYYGIVPSHRGEGRASTAMELFLEHLARAAPPQYAYISESVSINRPVADKIIDHFQKLGFVRFDDPNYGENAECGPTISLRTRIPGR
ncbi:MAG: GNAT family N-acetyltransferase [Patescibacteria group bacterium]|nr:GNAT family N-acetyltransferase [Patescibacteria group bacterium]MDE2116395.1 GNAT family N-acetyltransferase [Patescibacteria group bacterium]